MRKSILYSIIFTVSMAISGVGAYLLSPSKVVSAEESSGSASANHANHDYSSSEDEDDDFEEFVPVAMTPRDYLIDNLTKMKVLEGSADISLSYNDINLALNIDNVYLTLESLSLDDIELSVDASLTYNGVSTDIDVTYANGTIYLTALDTDIKLATRDLSKITDMLSSLTLPSISLPSELTTLSLDTLQDKLGNMPYEQLEDGTYTYAFELIDGYPIYFLSDSQYNFSGLKCDLLKIGDLSLSVNASVEVAYEIVSPVAIPETIDRPYANFCDILPLASHIADLVKQRQFALSLEGSIIDEGETQGITFSGSTQFDIEKKSGAGRLLIVEHEFEELFSHDVSLDISSEDVLFNYNNSIKGKLNFSSLNDVIELVSSFVGGEDSTEISLDISQALTLIEGTVLEQVLNGKYEQLLNNIIKDIHLSSEEVGFTIDKSFVGLDEDFVLNVRFNETKLLGIDVSTTILKRAINLSVNLGEYSQTYETLIDRSDIADYSDYANFIPLVNGIKALLNQRQFGLILSGSLKGEGEAEGLTFEGSTQFDLDTHCGDANLVLTENETSYSTKPVHIVKVGVNEQDVRFSYNGNLNGKMTIQTITDLIDRISELLESENSRVYQWFGDTISNMGNTIINKVMNGQYGLLFHNIVKSLTISDSELFIVVNGSLFGIDSDLVVTVGFSGDNKITSVSIKDFVAAGFTVNLSLNLVDWSSEYDVLPDDDGTNYYDFSDLKTLVDLGINVANLDYFHITGTANLELDIFGIDLSSFANLTDMPIEIEVFENNNDVRVHATLEGIPTVAKGLTGLLNLNGIHVGDAHSKTLELYYQGGEFYLVRHDWTRKYILGIASGDYYEVVDYVKTSRSDFVNHIIQYLLGWGMGLERNSTIWNKISGAMTGGEERTEAMDYSKLLTNYAFSDDTNAYGTYRWDLGLNLSELANNDDLGDLTATLYGDDMNFTNPETNEVEEKRYLTHLDADMEVNASVLSIAIAASLNLTDINPYLTYKDFATHSLTSSSWASFNQYLIDHASDSALSF